MHRPMLGLAYAGALLACGLPEARAQGAEKASAEGAPRLVRAQTPVEIEILETLTSKTATIDQYFPIALTASLLPARRAAQTDPLQALRYDN